MVCVSVMYTGLYVYGYKCSFRSGLCVVFCVCGCVCKCRARELEDRSRRGRGRGDPGGMGRVTHEVGPEVHRSGSG